MHIQRWIILMLMLAVGAAPLFAQSETPIIIQKQTLINEEDILAEFDSRTITRKDVDDRINRLPQNQQGRYRTMDGQVQVLDALIMEEMFMAKAIQLGMDKDPEIMEKIADGERQFFIQEFYKRNITDLVIITEADKQKYYEDNKQAYYEFPNLSIEYIQAMDEEAALAAIAQLEAGKSFAEVSDEFNINNYAKGLKGLIKNVRLNGNVPGVGNDLELEKLIAESQVSETEINGPFKTNTGWHIFRTLSHRPGRYKPYEEVQSELDVRARPGVENRMMESLNERLKEKFDVDVDTSRVDEIDLTNRENNSEIMDVNLIRSNSPNINISVGLLLDRYAQLSPQEQMFYRKDPDAAKNLLDQELSRSLLYAEAVEQNYERYVHELPDYEQMRRFYILSKAFRQLVVDSIEIGSEETRAFYDENIDSYTTPANRKIQVLWFNDAKEAEKTLSKYKLQVRFKRDKSIQKLIEENSIRPQVDILDNIYNNGIITGIGPDENFCNMVWENPIGYISPVFTSTRGDILFFRILEEHPAQAQNFTEVEPRIYGILKNQMQGTKQEEVTKALMEEFNLKQYPERITLSLSAEELFNIADNAARQRNFAAAISYYDQIITHYDNGSDDYRASFMKAFLVAEEVKDEAGAIELFKSFLKKYPEGELNESAQFMIDSLEGNVILEIED